MTEFPNDRMPDFPNDRISEEWGMCAVLLQRVFNNNEDVFAVFLHQVMLPRKFFEQFGIALQLVQLLFVVVDLVLKISRFLLELLHLLVAVVLGEHVILIEEQQPRRKRKHGQQIFILQDRPGFFHNPKVTRRFTQSLHV